MDQLVNNRTRKQEHLERFMTALDEGGIFIVNARGEILCALQDVTESKPSNTGLVAAIEAVIADTSAMGKSIIERITAFRRRADSDGSFPNLEDLTAREREVLGLICQGSNDREMSKSLGLSSNTVRNHIAALYRKIGVNRRGAAIIWAQERGITSEEALKPRLTKRPKRRPTQH